MKSKAKVSARLWASKACRDVFRSSIDENRGWATTINARSD